MINQEILIQKNNHRTFVHQEELEKNQKFYHHYGQVNVVLVKKYFKKVTW